MVEMIVPNTPTVPGARRFAGLLAAGLVMAGLALPGMAMAQQTKPTLPQIYIAPVPGQNTAPPQPRQNMVPTPPPTTRPNEGDSSLRIQGGSTRRQPLPQNQQ